MRIVAGRYGGRNIATTEGEVARPTTDRVREAIMSSLASRLGGFDGICVCDAFAGSGALGIESLSRGAALCVFTDVDSGQIRCIKGNMESLGIPSQQAIVVKRDVLVMGLPKASAPYDLVFLDPPYATEVETVIHLMVKARAEGVVSEGCIFVYERSEAVPEDVVEDAALQAGFEITYSKKYGKTHVNYFVCTE